MCNITQARTWSPFGSLLCETPWTSRLIAAPLQWPRDRMVVAATGYRYGSLRARGRVLMIQIHANGANTTQNPHILLEIVMSGPLRSALQI
ncbi:unnamed protein product [Lota lota]